LALNTAWLGGTVALDDDGFSLTGSQAAAEGILETSMPGVFAVGEERWSCASCTSVSPAISSKPHRSAAADTPPHVFRS
jgi:thioredoxin reductase